MATLSAILIWLIVGLLVVLSGILVAPVVLRAHLRTSPCLVYRVDARVLGGLLPRIPIIDSARPRKPKAARQKKKRAWSWQKGETFGRASIASELPRLVSDLLRTINFEHLNLDVEFGLYDPADTGQCYGYLTPLQYIGYNAQGVSVSLKPNFERACFAGEVDAAVRVKAVSLLGPIFRFVWTVFGPMK